MPLKDKAKRKVYNAKYWQEHYLDQLWGSISARTVNGRYAEIGLKNPKSVSHFAKGIRICDAWQNDKSAFIKWVRETLGERPKDEDGGWMSLDRIDNEGDYEPNNLRWANWETQANNRGREQAMKDAGYIEGYYGGTESF